MNHLIPVYLAIGLAVGIWISGQQWFELHQRSPKDMGFALRYLSTTGIKIVLMNSLLWGIFLLIRVCSGKRRQ